jgi:hypothetical protein
MIDHTHRIRAIQAINSRTANTSTKIVGVSATKTIGVGVSTMNILTGTIEWGFRMKGINKISVGL